jgi:hypothetical protein
MRSNEPQYTVFLNVSVSFSAFLLVRVGRRVSDEPHVPVLISIYHRTPTVCQAIRKSVINELLDCTLGERKCDE